MFDYLIVGAGYAGSVLAERLARGSGAKVLVIDKRNHIGGNAYDHYDASGLLIHKYGPHIFHTASREVFEYLSRFTTWRNYQHRVRASVDGQLVPIPINLDTINTLYGLKLSSLEVEAFLASRAEKIDHVKTSEDVVVSKVGRELYEKFFRGYTRKQWGLDPSELDAQVTARVPTRTNRDDRYFSDSYQAMPQFGYTKMFENMLDHPNIKVMLNADYEEIKKEVSFRQTIYTGPVDAFFNHRFGKLPYRCLEFKHETLSQEWFQDVAVVNYPNDYTFTRITEFKHLTGQVHPRTSIVYEYSAAEGDPYYPIPRGENAELYKKYQALAQATPDVHFVGRLATYRYYNMDQVVAQALTLYSNICGVTRAQALEAEQAPTTGQLTLVGGRLTGSAGEPPVSRHGNGNGHGNGHADEAKSNGNGATQATAGNGASTGKGPDAVDAAANGYASVTNAEASGSGPGRGKAKRTEASAGAKRTKENGSSGNGNGLSKRPLEI